MRVIKVGGRVQSDAALPTALANAWRAKPGELCVVHGGGDEISALQRAMGTTPTFVGGRRVTSAEDINVLRMALSGAANKRLVAAMAEAGVRAVGISGEDGNVLRATLLDRATLGEVGEPTKVDVTLLRLLATNGFLPLVSPIARSVANDATLNVNGDDAAAAIAIALGAPELLFVADVAGVLVGGRPVAALDLNEARALIESGEAAGGMQAKLQAAARALEGGVGQVRIGDLRAITDANVGTRIHEHAASLA